MAQLTGRYYQEESDMVNWQAVGATAATGSLMTAAIGLLLNGIGMLRSARIARNDFMLKFYDRVKEYNFLHLKLKEGWPESEPSLTEWNDLARYMGLFESLGQMVKDKMYRLDRADRDYSHRIVPIVHNHLIQEKCFRKDIVGWSDLLELWQALEPCTVFKTLAGDSLPKAAQFIPKKK